MNEQNAKEVVRLDYSQYQELEKRVGRIGVDHQSSPIEAGYQLGVQAVLRALRDGFVIGSPR